jgi:hypothetical protein
VVVRINTIGAAWRSDWTLRPQKSFRKNGSNAKWAYTSKESSPGYPAGNRSLGIDDRMFVKSGIHLKPNYTALAIRANVVQASEAAEKLTYFVIPSEARDLLFRDCSEKSRSLGQTRPSG